MKPVPPAVEVQSFNHWNARIYIKWGTDMLKIIKRETSLVGKAAPVDFTWKLLGLIETINWTQYRSCSSAVLY